MKKEDLIKNIRFDIHYVVQKLKMGHLTYSAVEYVLKSYNFTEEFISNFIRELYIYVHKEKQTKLSVDLIINFLKTYDLPEVI